MKPKTHFTEKDLTSKGFFEIAGTFYPPNSTAGKLLQAQMSTSIILETKSLKSPKIKPKKKETKIDLFVVFVKQQMGIDLVQECKFDEKRKWRFDYAIPESKLAIEQEGGVWSGGRHTRGQGYINDMEKYNAAALQGWTLIRRTPDQMMTEDTISLIRAALTVNNK